MKTGVPSFPVLIVALLLSWSASSSAATCQEIPYKSCFNQLAVNPEGDWSDYSFVVVGHLRSSPGIYEPNKVFRSNLERLFGDDPAFVIALGDLYYNLKEEGLTKLKAWVSEHIPVPFFNAVGNHDTQIGDDPLPDGTRTPASHDIDRYEQEFGEANYHFRLGSELFIFLDTGRVPIVSGKDWDRVKALLANAATDDSIKNIFVLSHKVFWSYNNDNPAMAALFRYRHPIKPPPNYRFFLGDLKPLLESLAANKHIFLISGDIGGGRKYLQTFYLEEPDMTYVATGMGNTPRDSFVNVSVKAGVVSLENINFSTGEKSAMENFGYEYWESFYRENPEYAAKADQIDKQRK
ncbi:MAG: metallophosphoesterase [Halioglobus sp.]|nr:metallophosphoesterase [Halioglobus sp.]